MVLYIKFKFISALQWISSFRDLKSGTIVWENKPLPAVTEGFKYTNNPGESIQKGWSLFKFKENLMKEIREDLNKWRGIP